MLSILNKKKYIVLMCAVFSIFILVLPVFSFGQECTGLICCGLKADGSDKCQFNDFIITIDKIIKFFIYFGTAFSAVVLMYVGFQYVTSAGNVSKMESAKGIFWKVIIGLVIMLSAWLIINFIETSLLKPEFQNTFLKG